MYRLADLCARGPGHVTCQDVIDLGTKKWGPRKHSPVLEAEGVALSPLNHVVLLRAALFTTGTEMQF